MFRFCNGFAQSFDRPAPKVPLGDLADVAA